MVVYSQAAGMLLVLSAVLTLAAPFIPSHAEFDADAPAEDIASFFEEDRGLQTLQGWLHPMGAAFLLVALLMLARPDPAGGRRDVSVPVLGAALWLAVSAVGFVVVALAMHAANEGYDPHMCLFLYNVGWGLMVFSAGWFVPFILVPFGIVARDEGVPRWLGTTSIVFGGLASLTALAMIVPQGGAAGFAGVVLLTLWCLIVGITLFVRPARPLPAPDARSAGTP